MDEAGDVHAFGVALLPTAASGHASEVSVTVDAAPFADSSLAPHPVAHPQAEVGRAVSEARCPRGPPTRPPSPTLT